MALEAIETKGSLTIENMHHVLHYTEIYQESLYLCKDILGRTGKVNSLVFFFLMETSQVCSIILGHFEKVILSVGIKNKCTTEEGLSVKET